MNCSAGTNYKKSLIAAREIYEWNSTMLHKK